MMFKGTHKRTPLKIAQSLESLGGSLNAFTSKEVTCFFANALDTYLNKTVEVLADIVCNSIFPDKEIVKERMVVLEEIKSVKDTPEEHIFDIFHEHLFPENALGRPILGKEDIVDNFSRSSVLNFWRNYYSAKNIIISAAGNLQHELLVKLINKYFNFNPPANSDEKECVSVASSKNYIYEQHINQAHICIGGESISYTSEYRFPLLVLNTYLGAGMSSRLFQKLREQRGLAYSVYSFTDFYSDIGLFGVYIGTDPKKLATVVDLLNNEFRRLLNNPLSPKSLSKIKDQLKGSLVLGLESTSHRMSRLAKNELYFGDYISIDGLINKIDRVSIDDVHEIANKVIKPNDFISVILQPSN